MSSYDREKTLSPVPRASGAKQGGEVRARWAWTEPCVWTERMLKSLERGVKGNVWFSLMDKVFSPHALHAAFRRVAANKGSAGVDHISVEQFASRLEEEIACLHEALRTGTYRPQCIKRVHIPKPGSNETRPLGIPTVRDRVVQTALRNALEPIYERDFAEHSYGFRPERSCRDALRRVERLLAQGYVHVVDADIKGYFDSIPHERLMALVKRRVSDGKVLGLVESFLSQGVLEGASAWTPEEGTPQGGVISPLLSNIYLDPLDHLMAAAGFEMVRYADDFVILCRTEAQAHEALKLVGGWMDEAALTLHPEKTRIVDARERGGFDFLGYHFERGMKWPRKKSLKKLKDRIRVKTRRTNGHSLKRIIEDLNPLLRGWYAYFKYSKANTFPTVDGWTRMRLRSILRKRMKKRGRGRGSDHQRWPNAYFTKHELFCLSAAHVTELQSCHR